MTGNEFLFGVIVVTALVFGTGYYLGVRAAVGAEISKYISKYVKDQVVFPFCIAEFEAGNYYLYDKNTQAFLCQANTMEQLAVELNDTKKIGVAYVMLPEGNNQNLFWFVRGKVKPVTNES